jgi:Tfp pilus assembly protein PilX
MSHNNGLAKSPHDSRGVALITSLLLLSLFTVLTLSMVIATTSDTLIDGYYRNARASFYGADSGVNAVRQALINDIYNNAIPSGYHPANGAPALTFTSSFPSDITSSSTGFGSYNSILGSSSSGSSSSWPGTFQLVTTGTNASTLSMTAAPGNNALCNPGSAVAITIDIFCVYNYNYHIVVDGQSRSGEVSVVEEYGQVPFSIHMKPTGGTTTSFSSWATLLDQYGICTGAFVPGTMSGKMFSNDSWNFGSFATKYIFNGNVGAHNAKVGYMYGGSTCDQSSATSDTNGGTTIAPTFSGGLSLGEAKVPLPTDSFSQMQAVLDGMGENCAAGASGCTTSSPSNATLAATLTNAAGSAWSSGASTGVYLPYTPGSPNTLNLNSTTGAFGGIYVQGNVDQMILSAGTISVGGSTHKTQVIKIYQGITTTTVTLDLTGGTTRIQDGTHDSGAMTGLPQNMTVTPPTEGCMVYVTGRISSNPSATAPTGLSGPSSGAAIQDGSGVTVTAGGTISITGNLTYSTEPVSLNVSDTPVSPAPTNVLGIYTNGGNVQLQPPSNVSTLEIDASIATLNGTSGSSYGITAVWNTITNVNIVGGRVQNVALSGSSVTARNIYFDQRFANGFSPPWFPTTTITGVAVDTAIPAIPVPQRTSWVNSSAQ